LKPTKELIKEQIQKHSEQWALLLDNFLDKNKEIHEIVLGGEHPKNMFKPKRKLP